MKKKKINWEPALVKNEDDGEFYWGDTDTPVVRFLTLDDCNNLILEELKYAGEEELLGFMKHLGHDAVLHDGEVLILERVKPSKPVAKASPGGMISSIGYRGEN
jgi:hypothetical protein